jgi:hypothetical protein
MWHDFVLRTTGHLLAAVTAHGADVPLGADTTIHTGKHLHRTGIGPASDRHRTGIGPASDRHRTGLRYRKCLQGRPSTLFERLE